MNIRSSCWRRRTASPSPPRTSPNWSLAAIPALHEAMVAAKVSNVELGRRMGLGENSVRRLRDPIHRSHVGQVEAALRTLGRRMVLEVATA